MKLVGKREILLMAISIVVGLLLTAYILYEQSGEFGTTELILLTVTALIAITICGVIIKRANK